MRDAVLWLATPLAIYRSSVRFSVTEEELDKVWTICRFMLKHLDYFALDFYAW